MRWRSIWRICLATLGHSGNPSRDHHMLLLESISIPTRPENAPGLGGMSPTRAGRIRPRIRVNAAKTLEMAG